MKTKNYLHILAVTLITALLIFLCGYGAFKSRAVVSAATEQSDGTDILIDLCSDPNFDINAYPIDEQNYALEVIQ
ncbi:MAG: hypothetical protein NC131_17535, partial [Roseburia sp.]|nr:hypothetical protein [Roseburia sp.]